MSRLPIVNKYLGILCFVANLSGESAMIFVCMRQNDAANIRDLHSVIGEFSTQRIRGIRRLWSDVDKRDRILLDQIDVDVADVERSWYGEGNYLHCGLRISDRGLPRFYWFCR